jgi:hypothetical protein
MPINEMLLEEIYQHFGLADYDVIQMISREIWKKKYDGVMNELLNPEGMRTSRVGFGDEKKFWKPEREVINYGLGSIFIDESKEQMITRQHKRKYPTGHLYSIRDTRRGNIWITADEVEMYRKTKNAWAKDTYEESLWHEVWDDITARTFVNSYYLSHFAKLFRIPKHKRSWWERRRGREWERVWRFHRVKDVPKFLKV